ncbi:MAG: hypothetical protein RLZZ31_341 [Actinomycetota bacterium]
MSANPSLSESFLPRHIGPNENDINTMLSVVGYSSLDALIDEVVPPSIRNTTPLQLPLPVDETAMRERLAEMAAKNKLTTSLIGCGWYDTITPSVIRRNVFENPAWYTAYTPYQPEISQGRLEVLLMFQTMVCDLTGMDIANASMLDEATAAAEAMTLAHRANNKRGNKFVVEADTHPQTIAVLQTRAEPLGIELVIDENFDDETFGMLWSSPTSAGAVRDLSAPIAKAKDAGVFTVVACDLLASTIITPPGEWGADACVGSAQRFGVPFGFGGPSAGFLAVREKNQRLLPGRLVGVSIDAHGRRAYRLTLQTREQHIRREKATSNICTAQVLLAVMAAFYAAWHGPDGLRAIAERVHGHTCDVANALTAQGFNVRHQEFFDTICLDDVDAQDIAQRARAQGFSLRVIDSRTVAMSFDETTTEQTVDELLSVFAAARIDGERRQHSIARTSSYLTHPSFTSYHSETEMMRWIRRLSDSDLALDRAMIPLGSCTMKLNSAAEMEPVSWPQFANLHPLCDKEDAAGYLELIGDLERWLSDITGYDAVSLQPNAGSQGEFAGLMAIRAYHASRGDHHRNVCLIPASAHGTNAASAAMAGMRVIVVACDENGNVDIDDLRKHIDAHAHELAALMITYPSTHGVFEEQVGEICGRVHDAGGQVYLDGANLNALVGVARPGHFGADVSHLNLHKTFCIPHGGGGPGVGPVAVRAHLAEFLPSHPAWNEKAPVGPVSAAPYGSAGILPIPWAYITMMGNKGLTKATHVAILSANYVAKRLSDHYPILYTGRSGLVAHECIIDIRPITKAAGISVDDVAKRLIDYGFHAPTMSFPVAGTLMVETTESESLAEVDRFCDAMIAIRAEIEKVQNGQWPADDNPLVNAPHTPFDVTADEWSHAYTREVAVWPNGFTQSRYWPPVSRIDGAYGDRNIMCSCPAIEDLAENVS